MTDPGYLPLERRVAIATEEIRAAEQVTGHPTMYAFNITGDLAGLRRRHDLGGLLGALRVRARGSDHAGELKTAGARTARG